MKRPCDHSVAERTSIAAPANDGTFLWPALAIFATAAALRLLHVWQIRRAPFFSVLMGDARGYDEWARRIASGDWIGTDVFYQAPLYPYLLGAVYTIAGPNLLIVRIVQALLGAGGCVLLAAAAARLFSRRPGMIAGFMLAVYAPAIFFDGLIQKSVLDVFFVCLIAWLISRLITSRGPAGFLDWLFLGTAMGGLALTRENALLLAVIVAGWALGDERRGASSRRRLFSFRLQRTAAFLLGLALVLVPVAIRNYAVGSGLYITTSQFGPNLFIGNNPKSDGTYMSLRFGRGAPEYERQDATDLAERALGRKLTPSEVSSYWTNRAIGFVTTQPADWARLIGRKFRLLWSADEMLDTESQETYAEWSAPIRFGSWFGHFGVLVPLALFGAWVVWPDRRRLWIFYVLTLAYAASVLLFYVFARYRFPLVPFLMLFAAPGFAAAWDYAARRIREAGAAGAVPGAGGGSRSNRFDGVAIVTLSPLLLPCVAGAAIFTNWPLLSRPLMQAITENNLAVAFQEAGQHEPALEHYRRAIALAPDYAPAHNNLGTALRAAGRRDDAVASYRRALELQPEYPDAHYNLANALIDDNRPQEAAEHFRIALASVPDSAATHNNLGIALANAGKLEDAIREFQAALRLEPDSAKTNRNLGKALSESGRPPDGLAYLRRAVTLDPADREAHYDLGSDLLAANAFPEAAKEFEAALALDPVWVEAHNNLGIALASMGRLDDAIAHFERALKIRPDFADARRNLAKSREIRGIRGIKNSELRIKK